MVEKTDVAAVLELIRPSLQADGGDVRLVDVSEDGVVTVELQGACKGLPDVPDDVGQRRRAHPSRSACRALRASFRPTWLTCKPHLLLIGASRQARPFYVTRL